MAENPLAWNSTSPAAPAGKTNVVFQADAPDANPSVGRNTTAYMPLLVGDSGSGGTSGAVPAPASGDAAAGKFLKADGTWQTPTGGGGGLTTDWSRDGSSLSGWTLGAVNPTVKTNASNPRIHPSGILCPSDASSRGYAFIDPAVSLANHTIGFDILVLDNSSIGYLIFGITSAGTGDGCFMDFRGSTFAGGVVAHFTAFVADAYVDNSDKDPMRLDKLITQWLSVKIVFDATAANVIIYVNGQMWSKGPVSNAGTGIAIGGASVGTGAYFRNLYVAH